MNERGEYTKEDLVLLEHEATRLSNLLHDKRPYPPGCHVGIGGPTIYVYCETMPTMWDVKRILAEDELEYKRTHDDESPPWFGHVLVQRGGKIRPANA